MFRALPRRLRGSRLSLPLLTAAALALPALWWVVGVGSDPGAEGPASAGGVRPSEVARLLERSTGEALSRPAVPSTERHGSSRFGSERRPAWPASALSADGLVAERAVDFGVVLEGHLRAAAPGPTGAVLIRALGPQGQVQDELGTIGAPYSLHGLAPGEWLLLLRGASIVETRIQVTIPPATDELELDLEVEPVRSIPVVFVTSWGERLESALAAPERDAAAAPLVEVIGTDLDPPMPRAMPPAPAGRYRGAPLGAEGSLPPVSGWLELHSPPPVEVRVIQAGREIERLRVDALVELLQIVVDPLEESGWPNLTGLLVDAVTGEPVRDAIVELFPAGGQAPVRSRRLEHDGTLRMAGIGEGDWVLSAWSSGRGHLLHSFALSSDADYDLGLLEMQPSSTLAGRLLSPDGRALGNRSLRWVRAGQAPDLALGYGREAVRTDAGGVFAIGGVPAGAVVLIAGGDEFAAGCFEFSAEPEGAELVVRLAPGTPVEIAVGGDSDERFELSILDGDDRTIFSRPAHSGRTLRVFLAPGDYRVQLAAGSQVRAGRALQITDEPLQLVLEPRSGD